MNEMQQVCKSSTKQLGYYDSTRCSNSTCKEGNKHTVTSCVSVNWTIFVFEKTMRKSKIIRWMNHITQSRANSWGRHWPVWPFPVTLHYCLCSSMTTSHRPNSFCLIFLPLLLTCACVWTVAFWVWARVSVADLQV